MAFENLCMNCMKDIGDEKQCPYCGFKVDSPQLPPYLPHRTVISNRYVIGNVIESNGDGITYIALDTEKKTNVVVREFLPDTIASRNKNSANLVVKPGKEKFYDSCLSTFLDMWRKLARMRGLSALVLVIDIVEENNTAYAILEHFEGAVTLRDYLLSNNEGYISWEEARVLFMPVLNTLSTLHSAGIIHRGISPNTLYVCPDHKIRIAGFSIPECRNVRTGIASEIFAGYAPVEQFGIDAPSGPWTDIYAFAAVLYRSLIGSTPIESTTRMTNDRMMIPAKFAEQIPAYVINALINALQIMPEDRTKNVEQFREELSASPTATIAKAYDAEPAAPVRPRTAPRTASTSNTAKRKAPRKTAEQKRRERLSATIKSAAISGGVLILIFIILCCTVLKDHFGNSTGDESTTVISEQTITVPDFVKMKYSSILNQFSSDFVFDVEEEYSDEFAEGYVISQSITPNESVAKGSTITLVVSLGKEKATMIDVVGKTYEEAEALLKEAGFTNISKKDYTASGLHTAGTVAKVFSNHEVGQQYEKDTAIKLAVYVDENATTTAQ